MKVKWETTAKNGMRNVARYVNKKFGRQARKDFIQKVKDAEELMTSQPNIGPIDPLYSNRPKTYHSIIINGLSKMVYRIDGDTIYIVDFWDTRREPVNQAAQTK